MSDPPLADVVGAGLTTIQDGGRRGLAAVGVPRSGAWHRQRYLLAAGLIAGVPDARVPALELLAGALEVHVRAATAMAVVGPADVTHDGHEMAVGAVFHVERDSRVVIHWRGPGPVYMTVSGWQPARVLGSAATDTFSRLGGEVVASGTSLTGVPSAGWQERVGAFLLPVVEDRSPLRVVPVGQTGLPEFAEARWSVRSIARSGVRLAGDRAGHGGLAPSAPTVTGAVQLTPSGEAIILGPDGGITGGYPVVGVVAAVDLDRLSLLAPGDVVNFRVADVAEASRSHRQARTRLRRALAHVHSLA